MLHCGVFAGPPSGELWSTHVGFVFGFSDLSRHDTVTDHLARSMRNFFCAGAGDRLAQWRCHTDWNTDALAHHDTRFVALWRDQNLMTVPGDAAHLLRAAQLPAGARLPDEVVLLGQLDGHTCFALALELSADEADQLQGDDARFCDLRRNAGLLPPEHGALLAYSRAMLFWHRRHRFCGECGAPTRSEEAGHVRACSNGACAGKAFPRTDPAVIVLISDADNERCLLGRQRSWVPGMYSCLAGFVEPGESLEHAVVREVREESGIHIASVRYRSSQPWPFPSSLMLGFRAVAGSEVIERGDEELEDARWFTRDDLARGICEGSLRAPNTVSIAFRLIEEWYDEGGEPFTGVLERARSAG